MKILVTGALGNLGGQLVKILTPEHDVTGIDIEDVDITDFAATHAKITALAPDVVLHPAAWTDVDACAREPQKAVRINGLGAQNVAIAAHDIGAAILYVSSNEVFDGTAQRPYMEYDPTNPANPYGYSKWVGERAIAAVNPRHYIVRTAWLFAHGGRNFLQAILGAAQAGKTLRVVTNEVANPTYNDDLAAAIAQLITTGRYGTYHLVNETPTSRYDFARYVLDTAGYTETPIERISGQQWRRASKPPEYAGLHNLAAASLGIQLRDWREAVDAFLRQEQQTDAP